MTAAPVPSQTRIVNAAYAELGSTTTINNIDDSAAHRAKRLWDDIVAEMLAEHPWNFQIRRKPLNATADVDLTNSEWDYACALPPDCARWLPPSREDKNFFRGEAEGRYLLVDSTPPIHLRYITSDVDIATWSPHFVRAMILRLAESLCDGVTQSEGKKDRLRERAQAALKNAKRIDGLQTGLTHRSAVTVQSSWLQARMHPNTYIGR
jgi:hypothetical protein